MIDDLNSEAAKIPSIGGLEGVTDPAVKKALLAIKETLEIYAGTRPRVSWLDKVLTNRDAFDYGVIGVVVNGETITGSNGGSVVSTSQPAATTATTTAPALDLTPPGAPLGLIATGTKLAVLLEWTTPASTVAYTEIIRAAVDNIGLAVLIGTTSASIYADIIGATDVTNYYWIRFVSKAGVVGDYNSISGTIAVTGKLGSNDLISVDGAKIIDATILNAKIANVSADKITTGTLAVGQAIQVGAATNRIFIDGSGIIRSGGMLDYLNGNGFYLRATLGSAQVAFGNSTTYIGFNGTDLAIQTPNLQLNNNSLTFNGSGTFNGNGTFSGNLSAVNGTLAALTIGTNGSITLGSNSAIKSGQTDFNTGSGFHLSNAGGISRFSVGTPSSGFTWSGSTFTVNGPLIATGNILNDAITITSTVYTAATIAVATEGDAGGATLIQSAGITTTGNKVLVLACFDTNAESGTTGGGGTVCSILLTLFMDGVALATTHASKYIRIASGVTSGGFGSSPGIFEFSHTPSAGAHTYSVTALHVGAGGSTSSSANAASRSLFAMEIKR